MTAAPAEPEVVAPIAIMDPSNVNQIAVAKESDELPRGGAPRTYHEHHRGSNASIHEWQKTRYMQGYDEKHPDVAQQRHHLEVALPGIPGTHKKRDSDAGQGGEGRDDARRAD